jgi:hypothetical protein
MLQRPSIVTLLSIAICLVFSVVGMNAARPFVLASRMRESNDKMERQFHEIEIQNQNDERELRALNTREGVELIARKHGFVFKKERKLRVPGAQ